MDDPRVEDMRDSPRRKRAASPDSASKRRTQTPTASGSGSSSRDVSPPSPSPAQNYFAATDASPSSSRTEPVAMDYELPPRSYVPYGMGRNPYSVNGGRYESNNEVHERLAGWSMNELGSLDPHIGPPARWNPNTVPRRESMYAASSPQVVRDALLAARAERIERLERGTDRPYLSRYEPLRRRNPEALDPSSLFEAGPSSVTGSGPNSGSESSSSGLASSSSFEPNWDMTGMYTRRTGPPPAPSPGSSSAHSPLAAAQARLRSPAERLAAFERRIYGSVAPPPSHAHAPPPSHSHASSSSHFHSSYNPAATPFGSALERGYYAYARGDPYTLIAVPPEFARYAFSRRRLPARLDGLNEDEKRQAARDALDAVGRLAPEEKKRLAEKVIQKVVYSELCAHAGGASSAASHSASNAETVPGGMMDNIELPAKVSWDAEVETACAICQDDYDSADEAVLTPCGHMYHSSCLGTWLARHNPAASTCPMCRRDLACLAVLRRMSDEDEAKRLWVSVGDEGERGGWI